MTITYEELWGRPMKTSEKGYAFIQRAEGFAAHTYHDNGRLAIGYGHDLQPGDDFPNGITQEAAADLLRRDVTTRFEPVLNHWLELHDQTANQNQYDALIDFIYNLGSGALVEMLSHGWYQVPLQMARWYWVTDPSGEKKADQALLLRRESEVELFRS